MKIIIDYESSWRNSFLDGDNNAPLPKKGRNFIASMTELKKNKKNFKLREITHDTVMGVLNRLIGEQRKLYQSRAVCEGVPYYFADIESKIAFEDKPEAINQESVYIRNMRKSEDQNSFTGMISVNNPIFQSSYSPYFWGVLWLDVESLYDFILADRFKPIEREFDPCSIVSRLNEIKKLKPVENQEKAKEASDLLQLHFDKKCKPVNAKGKITLLSLYCSALYLQLQRLENRQFDMPTAKSDRGGISGISHNGFTLKDFMAKYTTGSKKLIYGNPYVNEEFVKGEGKIKHLLTKASGKLVIHLDIDLKRACEMKALIENAGVSTFYLGKKGLAYVSYIDIR